MVSKLKTNYLPEFTALTLGRNRPSMVTVNLTDLCNQNCIYCELGNKDSSLIDDKLDCDDMTWIIDQMALMKIPRISLCGGEPLLFDGIIKVVEYAGQNNIRCTITSNGMTAHKLTTNELKLLKKYKTIINISIDSFNARTNNTTRGTERALSNALLSIKAFRDNDIPVTMLTVISRYNYQELAELTAVAHSVGITQLLFQPVIYSSNYSDKAAQDDKSQLNVQFDRKNDLMEQLQKIQAFERTHEISTNIYRIMPWIGAYLKAAASTDGKWFFKDVLPKFYCREIYAIIDIAYDGSIQACGLEKSDVNIRRDKREGLFVSWMKATASIKQDLEQEKYKPICNACCHHFSRNMMASVFKYPIQNRHALMNMTYAILSRALVKMKKKVYSA